MDLVKLWSSQIVVVTLILGRSRYQLFQLPVTFIKSFSTAEQGYSIDNIYLWLQVLVVSWTGLFFTAKMFWGD